MPYVTDDDSKAARRIAEIEQQLQEAKAEFDRWLAAGGTPTQRRGTGPDGSGKERC